jgi:hypothetical protein
MNLHSGYLSHPVKIFPLFEILSTRSAPQEGHFSPVLYGEVHLQDGYEEQAINL